VTPTIFDIRSNISLKLLELETSNLVCSFVWAMPSRRRNNFPESGRGLGHVTSIILAVRSAILATAWLLVNDILRMCHRPRTGKFIAVNMTVSDLVLWKSTDFYPRDAMLARVIAIATCPSVRLSVCPSVRHAPVLCQTEES